MTTDHQKTDKWLDRKLERRTLLKKAAIGGASLAVLYVAPSFTSTGAKTAYATTGGFHGCTPGFWKNSNSQPKWDLTPWTRSTKYESVFGTTAQTFFSVQMPASLTLQQAMELPGTCPEALARHSVAAVLNAFFGTIGKTVTEVINETNAALVAGCAAIDVLRIELDDLNNDICLDFADD